MARSRGTATLEFGLTAGPLLTLFLLCMEAPWQLATSAALDYAALRASRFGITGASTLPGLAGAPACRAASIAWLASAGTGGFLRAANLSVSIASYPTFASAAAAGPGSSGAGSGGQTAVYVLSYRQPFLVAGFASALTGRDSISYTATLVVKNEPFDNAAC